MKRKIQKWLGIDERISPDEVKEMVRKHINEAFSGKKLIGFMG